MSKALYELNVLSELFLLQLRQIFPYWLAGTLLGSGLSVYAFGRIARIAESMKGKNAFFQLLAAAVLGVASPVCMYGTVPVIVALGRKGVSQDVLAAFHAQLHFAQPQSFSDELCAGVPLALLRLALGLAGGVLGGALTAAFFRNKAFFDFRRIESACRDNAANSPKRFFRDVGNSMRITGRICWQALLLTALFDRYFPPQLMDVLFLQNKALSVAFHGVGRGSGLSVRRRHDSAAGCVAARRAQPGFRSGVYALRPRHKADEPWRGENYSRRAQLCFLYPVWPAVCRRCRAADGHGLPDSLGKPDTDRDGKAGEL